MNIVCTADNKCNFSVNFINQLNEKQMIKNQKGEVVFEEDEIEREKRDKMQTKVIVK